jgi:hypothetical protein
VLNGWINLFSEVRNESGIKRVTDLLANAAIKVHDDENGDYHPLKTGWHLIRIICPSGATCLSADCCFSKLALYKSNSASWSSIKRILSSYHWMSTCYRHDRAENYWTSDTQQSLTQYKTTRTHNLPHSRRAR